MPIYEFRCEDSKSPYHEKPLQLLLSIQEYEATKDKIRCPITNKPMKRVFNGKTGLKFNGTGFYCTDYK